MTHVLIPIAYITYITYITHIDHITHMLKLIFKACEKTDKMFFYFFSI